MTDATGTGMAGVCGTAAWRRVAMAGVNAEQTKTAWSRQRRH